MAELKPCPFCGAELLTIGDKRSGEFKHPRNDCFLAVADTEYEEVWFYSDDEQCIEKWNRRAEDG